MMIIQKHVDELKEQIKWWEKFRDSTLRDTPDGNLEPIFKKIDDLHRELLDAIGYPPDDAADKIS